MNPTIALYLLVFLAALLLVMFTVWYIGYRKDLNAIFESKVEQLLPDNVYHIRYGANIFGKRGLYEIIPKDNHVTFITTNIRYDGSKFAVINVYTATGTIIFSVYFDNFESLKLQ
jgi:hypothetical protein